MFTLSIPESSWEGLKWVLGGFRPSLGGCSSAVVGLRAKRKRPQKGVHRAPVGAAAAERGCNGREAAGWRISLQQDGSGSLDVF